MQQPTLFKKIKSIRLDIVGVDMTQHIIGQGKHQMTLLPEVLDDFVTKDNPVRVFRIFVHELQLDALSFERVNAKQTGRPGVSASRLPETARRRTLGERTTWHDTPVILTGCAIVTGWHPCLSQ
ncbi:hypothetical protein [Rahnella ecdela]|uniref:Transposase n=1 Tax=Rahnella ecdela TaxID=2816250 RepID=A0ABS6LAZ5_9GAMM|nr:hypothetical protein [Rahnella ecdela]